MKSTVHPSWLIGVLYFSGENLANQPLLRKGNWPRKLPNSAKYSKIMAITPLKVIQGHRFWYQSRRRGKCASIEVFKTRRLLLHPVGGIPTLSRSTLTSLHIISEGLFSHFVSPMTLAVL